MTDEADDLLERTIASACCLVGEYATVRSVSVVGGRRLTAGELLRSHERAAACDADLTMDGAGVVTVRGRSPHVAGDRPAAPRRPRGLLFLPRLRLRQVGVTGTGASSKG